MKKIPLTQGLFALVDDDDYEWLMQWKWQAYKHCNTFYARRFVTKNKRRATIRIHQQILGIRLGMITDHKDGNGLNNQRHNLRHVTVRQNAQNRHIKKTSKYPGVHWEKRSERWQAQIGLNGRRKHLGYFTDERDAFSAYKEAVQAMTGQDVIEIFV